MTRHCRPSKKPRLSPPSQGVSRFEISSLPLDTLENPSHSDAGSQSPASVASLVSTPVKRGIDVENLIVNSTLVSPADRGLVPDSIFVAMGQMEVCVETDSSQKARPLGFAGFQCKYCGRVWKVGNFFSSAPPSFTVNSCRMVRHLEECSQCPPPIRDALLELQCQEVVVPPSCVVPSTGRCRRGYAASFYQRVWAQMNREYSATNAPTVKHDSATATPHLNREYSAVNVPVVNDSPAVTPTAAVPDVLSCSFAQPARVNQESCLTEYVVECQPTPRNERPKSKLGKRRRSSKKMRYFDCQDVGTPTMPSAALDRRSHDCLEARRSRVAVVVLTLAAAATLMWYGARSFVLPEAWSETCATANGLECDSDL
jgi:hypothetical protein